MADDSEVLSAPLVIEYPFTRTTGPVIGAFLTGLREQVLLGIKGRDGRVIVPPTEYDPVTGEELTELVEVGPGGVVDTWAWVRQPMPKHPLQRPVRLGAGPARRRRHRRSSRRSTPARSTRCPPACA